MRRLHSDAFYRGICFCFHFLEPPGGSTLVEPTLLSAGPRLPRVLTLCRQRTSERAARSLLGIDTLYFSYRLLGRL